MNLLLDLISGVCWSLAYAAAVIRGLKYRTWCIPGICICFNFSWELLIVLSHLQIGGVNDIPFYIHLAWLILDVGILATWIFFVREKRMANLCTLAATIITFYFLVFRGGYWEVVAFTINLIMSLAFICRYRYDSTQWASLFIAVCKLIGTAAATLLCGIIQMNPVALWLGGLCLILDIYYVATLCSKPVPKG